MSGEIPSWGFQSSFRKAVVRTDKDLLTPEKTDKDHSVGGSVLSRVKMFEQVNQEIRKTSTVSSANTSPSTSEKPQEVLTPSRTSLRKDNNSNKKPVHKQQVMDTYGDELIQIDDGNNISKQTSSNSTTSISKDNTGSKYFSQRKTQIVNNMNQSVFPGVSKRDTPDPLDREAVKHVSLKKGTTSSSMEKFKNSEVKLNAPERIRKFKLAEESMRRVRDRGFSETSQTNSTMTNSGVRSSQGEYSNQSFMNMSHVPVQYSEKDVMHTSTKHYDKSYSLSSEVHVPMRESEQMNFNITSPSSLSGRRGLPVFTDPVQLSFKMSPHRSIEANDYFSIGGGNFYSKDDDDETQFNSVYMPDPSTNDRLKKGQPNDQHVTLTPVYRSNENANLDFEHRMDGHSKNISFRSQQQDRKYQDISASDDDESFTDNRSWTGRMRAQKAAQKAMNIDRRTMMHINDNSRATVVTSLKKGGRFDDNDDNISVTSRVFNSVNREKKLAYADAKEGIDEVKKIAKNDPTTAAVGAGVVTGLMGSIALGPIGLLLGAGVAGLGYKVAQLPEDERTEVGNKASTVAQKIHRSAVKASHYLSNKCAQACGEGQDSARVTSHDDDLYERRSDIPIIVTSESLRRPNSPQVKDAAFASVTNLPPTSIDISSAKATDSASLSQSSRSVWRIAPACKRMSRITPVGQIHSLDPALHARAWLDVMASAWTTYDEKNEAMEEILLLSKDKNHARMLLEEGILDAFMYILRSFFKTYTELQSRTRHNVIALETFMTDPHFYHAKLAANCCVSLGKAHCAVLNIDGEERIAAHVSIPVNRQVAQMLYEIPHHKVMVDNDSDNERFVLSTDMTMEQAIELAGSIEALSMGKIEMSDLML